MAERIDAEDLDVNEDDILVLKNIGPTGAPGMPEAGYLPIPKKLARSGVKDMVRISDGRMSGTAGGTIVLHVTPEAAIGGALAIVQTGDRIRLSVKERSIQLLVSEADIQARLSAKGIARPTAERGYKKLYLDAVLQADHGVDFDFLRPAAQNGAIPADPTQRQSQRPVQQESESPARQQSEPATHRRPQSPAQHQPEPPAGTGART
jgi:dihydroxy-acid dehydratase